MNETIIHTCNSLQQMQTIAAELVQQWQPGQVICLSGTLGAGKTTLVQAMLQAMGYQDKVTSPTFTIVEPYTINDLEIYHFDLYRLESPDELEMIGFHHYFNPNSICFIEWPEKAGNALPKINWHINIEVLADLRQITITQNPNNI